MKILGFVLLCFCTAAFSVTRPIPYYPIGVTYSGLHGTRSPSVDTVSQDIDAIKKYRDDNNHHFIAVRTYYPQYNGGTIQLMPRLSTSGLKVLLGLYIFPPPHMQDWTTINYQQDVKPFLKNKHLLGVLVGNEDYPVRKQQIIAFIDQVKKDAPTVPVSTAQTPVFWLNESNDPDIIAIVNKCDFIAVNVYPLWDWYKQGYQNQPFKRTLSTGVDDVLHAIQHPVHTNKKLHFIDILRTLMHPMFMLRSILPHSMHISDLIKHQSIMTPEQGFASFKAQYEAIHEKYPDKQIVVTETGWPTTYGRVVDVRQRLAQYQIGLDNAKAYYAKLSKWSAEHHVNVFYYSMFDDYYASAPQPYSQHFGLLNTKRMLKNANVH